MIKILELFGGIGSPRKALLNLGYPHKAIDYVEIDEKSVRTYNALYDHLHKPQSVVGWNLKPDILVHGSPCQDFSRAGKRLGGNDEDKTRSSLMWETIRIIENMGKWKPKVVVWENVKGVLAKDMIHSFKKYFVEMERLGYTNNYQVLDARDFGIPQKRERVFVISMLDGHWFNFDALEHRPTRNVSEFILKQVDDKYTITSPSMLRAINNRSGFGGGLKPIEKYSWTITTKQNRVPNSGIVPLGNGKYRLLTELECWRLMGFDDEDYYKVASEHPTRKNATNGTLYKQAGNSIVVQVLEAIFKQIIDMGVINDESIKIY
ncbi:DNA cytosine methyltransferase [Staphylococcus pseudintermedius]|uniref:DNA cytosine methyltransferase n=1 Tax=Staphylococcus pseudintermedius TaxID=283734 RepID=UPI0019327508|nr:DNA cytosine methyltransferase [Staphylococcus pseudintermedius]EGQ1714664.1 DNA cytosine methyltransferase [Staphylococcus pseudintermedius]MBM0305349.1 DNA cytosine methyltransferase [Staphylococcus pseudintermedius]MCE5623148.1 DNA cytosine methyltransferase [Staphylococcus pseudintermedius]HAR5787854.1 DNA cytosine methyltransferase [Staphylococcus pseudintermedius]HCA7067075.1 DNA cytosine methyltransferase [Staphylococcus pseudintermedius]